MARRTIPGTQIVIYDDDGPSIEEREKDRTRRLADRIDAQITGAGSELEADAFDDEFIQRANGMTDEELEVEHRRKLVGPMEAEMQRVAALEAGKKA